MDNKSVNLLIATRLFDLDQEVYTCLQSTLGRVYTQEKEVCIKQIVSDINQRNIHVVRSEMALILNMIHTVEEQEDKDRLLQEYDEIKKMLSDLPIEMSPADILNTDLAEIKKPGQHNLIICIGRQFGSAGTEIGFELAKRLKLEFYDKEIFEMVMHRLEVDQETVGDEPIDSVTKHSSFLEDFSKYHGLSRQDAFFFNQSDLINKLAQEQSCVIVGRCAEVILTQSMVPHYSIFIEAPFELRVKRTMEMKKISYKKAVHFVNTMDRYHRKYYNSYTGKKWGSASNYDLCINSATYGIDGTVAIIERMIVTR